MKIIFPLLLIFFCQELYPSPELSTFSLKRDHLLIKIPKIWKWKTSAKEEAKNRFRAKSRNGFYYYLVRKLSEKEELDDFLTENKMESLECDIITEDIQSIRLKIAEIYKYKRKNKVGYILLTLQKSNRFIILFELNHTLLESNREFILDLFNGVRVLD